jgi:hypothetical protein
MIFAKVEDYSDLFVQYFHYEIMLSGRPNGKRPIPPPVGTIVRPSSFVRRPGLSAHSRSPQDSEKSIVKETEKYE